MVGNVLHDSVPVSQSEDDNEEIRKWGVDGASMDDSDDDIMSEDDIRDSTQVVLSSLD